jgi:hypothetical protein
MKNMEPVAAATGFVCPRSSDGVMSKLNIDITFWLIYPSYMARTPRVPFTLRIGAEERSALENLSKVEGRPMNQLLNEAIKSYLGRQGRKERSLVENLAKLRAYRKQDPGFKHAIAAFVEAEATVEDPLEGEAMELFNNEDLLKPAGPVQSKIREVLDA